MYVDAKGGKSAPKQVAYARRTWGAEGKNKKQIALDVGYSPSVANSVVAHIENTRGFQNAMIKLAHESNNLALAALAEFKARGFDTFTNQELIGSLNAIAGAWSKFNAPPREEGGGSNSTNRLRTVILQRVENQTISSPQPAEVVEVTPEQPVIVQDSPLDF